MARIGQIVDGKFRILRSVGHGGMSRVYLARDIRLEKKWIIKEIPKHGSGGKNSLLIQAALSEAQIIKSLDHPAVVRIVDITQDDHAIYIVEDYVEGIPLQEAVRERRPLEPEDLRNWAEQLCHVMIYLHSRKPPVIYRDFKPENIILTESGHIRLIDFGIARRYRPENSRDTVYMGTVQYAAPEQFEEFGAQTDQRTDIYGFGKTLEYLADFSRELSFGVYNLIDKCIRPDPKDRFQSGEELLKALEKIGDFAMKSHRRKRLIRCFLSLSAGAVLFLAASGAVSESPAEKLHQEILGFLEEIRTDGIFSVPEEEQLLRMLMPSISELKETEGFGETAYEIGRLYWEHYAYGSKSTAAISGALPFMELAGEAEPSALIYRELGQFRLRRQALSQQNDPGVYRDLLEQLLTLTEHGTAGDLPAALKVEICREAADSLISDTYLYRQDDCTARDVRLVLSFAQRMYSDLQQMAETEQVSLPEGLNDKLDRARRTVEAVYPDDHPENQK